jgi:hypothetical protein
LAAAECMQLVVCELAVKLLMKFTSFYADWSIPFRFEKLIFNLRLSISVERNL